MVKKIEVFIHSETCLYGDYLVYTISEGFVETRNARSNCSRITDRSAPRLEENGLSGQEGAGLWLPSSEYDRGSGEGTVLPQAKMSHFPLEELSKPRRQPCQKENETQDRKSERVAND